jgi:hypothetical protein
VRPCMTLGIRGTVTVDGSMVMFVGDADMHAAPGQSMSG